MNRTIDGLEELSLLKDLDTVKAPPGFEQGVMARLSLAKREAGRPRRAALKLSLAGAFAGLLALFVGVNVFVLREKPAAVVADKKDAGAPAAPAASATKGAQQLIPVIETFDYASELGGRSAGPQTVYLLEQVSDTVPRGVTY